MYDVGTGCKGYTIDDARAYAFMVLLERAVRLVWGGKA